MQNGCQDYLKQTFEIGRTHRCCYEQIAIRWPCSINLLDIPLQRSALLVVDSKYGGSEFRGEGRLSLHPGISWQKISEIPPKIRKR